MQLDPDAVRPVESEDAARSRIWTRVHRGILQDLRRRHRRALLGVGMGSLVTAVVLVLILV
jgi:hypothetical protein